MGVRFEYPQLLSLLALLPLLGLFFVWAARRRRRLLGRFAEYSLYEKCRDLVVDNCIDCGLCAYVCPARRPLVQYFRQARAALRKEREEAVEQA